MAEFSRKPNGIAEDLGGIIGFSNTLLLCATRGGQNIYVPNTPTPGHVLETLLGASAFARLVETFGGESFTLPMLSDFNRYQRIRRCAQMICEGKSLHAIARENGVTYNQTKNDRRTAEKLGLLPLVFTGPANVPSDDAVFGQSGFDGF